MGRPEPELGALRVVRGEVAYEVALRPGALVIGRDARLGLCLNDASVSRRHAVLVTTAAGVELHALSARNGVAVNGARIAPRGRVELRSGDRLRLGDTELRYTAPTRASAGPAAAQPSSPVEADLAAASPPAATSSAKGPSAAAPRLPVPGLAAIAVAALLLALAATGLAFLATALLLLRPAPAAPLAPSPVPVFPASAPATSVSPPGSEVSAVPAPAGGTPAPLSAALSRGPTPLSSAPAASSDPARAEVAAPSSAEAPSPAPAPAPQPAPPAASAPAAPPAPTPAERAALAGLFARLVGRDPAPDELSALLAGAGAARVELLLGQEGLHARAWAAELEHQGLSDAFAPSGAAWEGLPAQLQSGARDPLQALEQAVRSPLWARRHLGALATARAVFERVLAAPGRPVAPSRDWWAAQRAGEGEEVELLGGRARSGRELLRLALAHPEARLALQGRMAARALGRPPTAAEQGELAAEIERRGTWFAPLVELALRAALAPGPQEGS